MSSNRIEKVNSLLEQQVSNLIAKDFDFKEMVTVTHVDVTANLIEARVYISVFPEDKADSVIKILKNNVYSIQKALNKKLNMRPIPKIIFVKDQEIAHATRVEELLYQLKKEEK